MRKLQLINGTWSTVSNKMNSILSRWWINTNWTYTIRLCSVRFYCSNWNSTHWNVDKMKRRNKREKRKSKNSMNHTSEFTMSIWQVNIRRESEMGRKIVVSVTHIQWNIKRQTIRFLAVHVYFWSDDESTDIQNRTLHVVL